MTEVSVIVPTYERFDKLERGLKTVLDQSYQDLELIVVDDNSSQKYREKARDIVEKISDEADFPVKRIVNENNQGVSSARNLGIEKASGRYIAFLDDDDEWKSRKVEKQVEKIEEDQINAVYTAAEMYNGEVNDIVRKAEKLDLEKMLERNRIGSPSKVMVEKEWLEKVNGFDEDIPSAEDWDIWIRLMNEGCKFGYIDEPLTRYYQDDDSKSNQFEIATEGREKITQKHSELLERAGSKVKARHHLNRAKKQYTLGDSPGTRKNLSKTLKNNPLEFEAYALSFIYLFRRITGLELMDIAVKIKGVLR